MNWFTTGGRYFPYSPQPQPALQPIWPQPTYTQWPQKQLVDCAACKGTGLAQRYRERSIICKGCNGAGKQRV